MGLSLKELQEQINVLQNTATNKSQLFVQATDPALTNTITNNAVWIDTNEKLLKVYINNSWQPFGAVYQP